MDRVGVLAMQGAFVEHIAAFRRLGVEAVAVRRPEELVGLDGLVIPGGESTTIARMMARSGLVEPVRRMALDGVPVLGTCAGMILLARQVEGLDAPPLRLMDICVRRNAFGRQVDSFETDLAVSALDGRPFHAVFIRAPLIESIGEGVEALAGLADGTVVAARQETLLAMAFHPELTDDLRFHEYFLGLGGGQTGLAEEKP